MLTNAESIRIEALQAAMRLEGVKTLESVLAHAARIESFLRDKKVTA
jgi:hypothetical protein